MYSSFEITLAIFILYLKQISVSYVLISHSFRIVLKKSCWHDRSWKASPFISQWFPITILSDVNKFGWSMPALWPKPLSLLISRCEILVQGHENWHNQIFCMQPRLRNIWTGPHLRSHKEWFAALDELDEHESARTVSLCFSISFLLSKYCFN